MDTGTVKSIEKARGTGSIAPDKDASVHSDTGFTRSEVAGDAYDALRVGERVHFDATKDPERPGYANAQTVESIEPDHEQSALQRDEVETTPLI
jgi:cold shock CspA family protein